MAEEKRKISELPSNDSPSTSTVLVGVDGGDTVKIPITEFVLSGSTNDITISSGRDIEISANDAVEISANRTLGITAVDHITVESSNTMSLNSDGANISFLPDGDMELFADGNIDLYSDNYVSLTSNGDMSITSEGAMSVNTPGLLGLWGDQTGLYGTNCVEFLAGENDESYLYADGDCMQIVSPKISLHNVDVLTTKNNGLGRPGQVLTTDGRTVYWGDPSGGGSGGSTPMTYITYDELKALRDNGQLIPGMFYRITDYQCTTSQDGTRATNHRFGIIVQALSEDRLSEIAKADFNDEDSYFAYNGANLAAWEIKYCLDNDTTRFAWALDGQAITNLESMYSNGQPLVRQPSVDGCGDGEYQYAWGTKADADDGDNTNFWYSKNEVITDCETVWSEGEEQIARVIEGKGVIYYMKDEHGNECPYDFKNIQFKRVITLDNGYPEYDPQGGDHTQEAWVYTFCGRSYHIDNDEWSELKDGSLESPYGHESDEGTSTFHNNVIGEYRSLYDGENEDYTKCGKLHLSNNVFFGYWEEIGSTDPENYPYYYAYGCMNNKLGTNCYNNTFHHCCSYNTFGNYCSDNILGDYCVCNTFGDYCVFNTFNEACGGNHLGYGCGDNVFDVLCNDNALGRSSWGNVFGYYCVSNTFNKACQYTTFGELCDFNTFADTCYETTFGDYCNRNYFALSCSEAQFNGSGNFVACNLTYGTTLNKSDSFITSV